MKCFNSNKSFIDRMGSTISVHKKQVSCCAWNQNGNWLATGSRDGLIKLFDIRKMAEFESYRGHNSDVSDVIRNVFTIPILLLNFTGMQCVMASTR